MAYGTETVPRVDKVLGPGNLFVVLAKRRVFGAVAIDQLPGPTETLVLADEIGRSGRGGRRPAGPGGARPLATPAPADHLGGPGQRGAERPSSASSKPSPPRPRPATPSAPRGGAVVVESVEDGLRLANAYAPEHLCLLLRDPWAYVGRVRHAGGVFVGSASPEAAGDYVAGPSHIMPTGGTARFASPLSVDDFVKIVSVVGLSAGAPGPDRPHGGAPGPGRRLRGPRPGRGSAPLRCPRAAGRRPC